MFGRGCRSREVGQHAPAFTFTASWSCVSDTSGCTDSNAANYDPLASADDGSCASDAGACAVDTAVCSGAVGHTCTRVDGTGLVECGCFVQVWPTAAIPMDNPYCSCKPTRVLRSQFERSSTQPLLPYGDGIFAAAVSAARLSPCQVWPYSCSPYGESLLKL